MYRKSFFPLLLLVLVFTVGQTTVYNQTGGTYAPLTEVQTFPTGFNGGVGAPFPVRSVAPAGIAHDGASLFLVDSEIEEGAAWGTVGNNNIFQIPPTGGSETALFVTQPGGALEPTGIAVCNGFFFITNDDTQSLYAYNDLTQPPVATISTVSLTTDPEGVTCDPGTNTTVYVAGGGTEKLATYTFDNLGTQTFTPVSSVNLGGSISDAFGIAFDPTSGNLFVVSRVDGRMYEYQTDGTEVGIYPLADLTTAQIRPQGVAIGPSTSGGGRSFFISDGTLDDLRGQVTEARINSPIAVTANGPALVVLPAGATLTGFFTDPGGATSLWTHEGGTGLGTVNFVDATNPNTDASFAPPPGGDATGEYILRLTVTAPGFLGYGEVTVRVVPAGTVAVDIDLSTKAQSDDAEEILATGAVDVTHGDLNMSVEFGACCPPEGTPMAVGLRFPDVTVPTGSDITFVTIQFTTNETDTDPSDLTIRTEATNNAATFVAATNNITNRPLSFQSVNWQPAPWTTIDAATPNERTVNLATIVKEIIVRSGWASGNGLAFVITGTGERVADSKNAVLHIEYNSNTPPTINTTPTFNGTPPNPEITLPTNSVNLCQQPDCNPATLVTDDNLPAGNLTTQWTHVGGTGTGTVVFDNAAIIGATATINAPPGGAGGGGGEPPAEAWGGTYILQLAASDGEFTITQNITVTVNADTSTTTTIDSNLPNPSVVGEPVTVTYSVDPAVGGGAPGTPTGNVTVSNGIDQCTSTVAAGACAIALSTVGSHTLTATYAGDATFTGSVSPGVPQQVNAATTTTTITSDSPDPSATGVAVAVSFNVAVDAPGGGSPTGNVTVTDGVIQCVVDVSAGSCNLTFTSPGNRTLTATYAGDGNYTGSVSPGVPHQVDAATTTTTITSDSPDPSNEGDPITVNFTVTALAGGTPTGTVSVTDGVDSCNGTLSGGAGSCQLTLNTEGARTLVATYSGDATFTGSASAGEPHQVDAAAPSTISVNLANVNFGGVLNGGAGVGNALVPVTSAQTVTITQEGTSPIDWQVTPNEGWIEVSPTSGSGSGTFDITITNDGSLPGAGSTSGSVTITSSDPLQSGLGEASPPINVTVTVTTYAPGTTGVPFGVIDTPIDGVTNVAGSLGVTGWALDDVEIARVRIFRDPVPPEAPGTLIFVGDAVLVFGARPDVAAANPSAPFALRAGWGFLILTNMLPNQGNGTYVLHMFAEDAEGNSVLLGTRTFTADNASSTLPFGAIDTPGQGETINGTGYINFGWALTPLPAAIPTDGSTLTVFINGLAQGNPTYNNFRSDIATLFPGLANSDGAVGFFSIDTTVFPNGVHTIEWSVVDNLGAATGIGSRFFSILNGGAPATAGASRVMTPPLTLATSSVDLEGGTASSGPIFVRDGFDLGTGYTAVWPGLGGVYHVSTEMLGRLEIDLSGGLGANGATYSGTTLVDGAQVGLPIGSSLDPATGQFTWQPGVGYFGTHRFVFGRATAAGTSLIPVDVTLTAQYSEQQSARMWIDLPGTTQVGTPFIVAGWAIDRAALSGSGVDAVHVWAYPNPGSNEAPIFLGVAGYGGARPDVGSVFGAQFAGSGFGLIVESLPAGTYDIVAFAHSAVSGEFNNAQAVRVTVN